MEDGLVAATAETAADRFLRIADRELNRAYHVAGLVLGDAHEAEDAAQESLLRAWRSMASLRDPAGFQTWFDRILINVCRDRLRRRSKVRFIALDPDHGERAAADPFNAVLDRDEMLRAMAHLDYESRVVIVLHYWADLTLDGVAERVGWPVGTVKSRLHRALEHLREELGEAAEEVAR